MHIRSWWILSILFLIFFGCNGVPGASSDGVGDEVMGTDIPGTNCTLVESSPIMGVQCIFTNSQDGTVNKVLNLADLIFEINTGLFQITGIPPMIVGNTIGIEAISGKAGKGGEFFGVSGGNPGAPGYAVTVQTLNEADEIVIPSMTVAGLFFYVGQNATTPEDKRGGNGGTASIVTGKKITGIPSIAILFPTGGINSSGEIINDQQVFVIAGGPGGGSETNTILCDGACGGDGGSMATMGPVITQDMTVAGEAGCGGTSNSAGSQQGDGIGGASSLANFNPGTDGVGGFGGGNDHWVESSLTSDDWANGMGGARGSGGDTQAAAGGGGWGGGSGGGENGGFDPFWTGGSGAGTFARQSVSTGPDLPTLFNLSGGNVDTNNNAQQIILSFSVELDKSVPGK